MTSIASITTIELRLNPSRHELKLRIYPIPVQPPPSICAATMSFALFIYIPPLFSQLKFEKSPYILFSILAHPEYVVQNMSWLMKAGAKKRSSYAVPSGRRTLGP